MDNNQKRMMREAIEAEWYGLSTENFQHQFEQNITYLRDVASYAGPIADEMVQIMEFGRGNKSAAFSRDEATGGREGGGLDKE